MRHNPFGKDQLRLNRFIAKVRDKLQRQDLPAYFLDEPELVDHLMHEVVTGCSVYVLTCNEGDAYFVKVGLARDIRSRLSSIATACPLDVECASYFCLPGYGRARKLEVAIHKKFEQQRVRGEWFRFEGLNRRDAFIQNVIEFAKDWLKEDFHQFQFSIASSKGKNYGKAKAFLQAAWALTTGSYAREKRNEEVEAILAQLTATSSDYHEKFIRKMQHSKLE